MRKERIKRRKAKGRLGKWVSEKKVLLGQYREEIMGRVKEKGKVLKTVRKGTIC